MDRDFRRDEPPPVAPVPSGPRCEDAPLNLKVVVGQHNEGRQVHLPEPRNDIVEGQGQASAPVVKKFNFTESPNDIEEGQGQASASKFTVKKFNFTESPNDIEEGQGQASAPVKEPHNDIEEGQGQGQASAPMDQDQPAAETANAAAEPMDDDDDDCPQKRHRRFETEDIANYPKRISRDVSSSSSGKMDRMIGLLLPKIRITMPGSSETLKPFTCGREAAKIGMSIKCSKIPLA